MVSSRVDTLVCAPAVAHDESGKTAAASNAAANAAGIAAAVNRLRAWVRVRVILLSPGASAPRGPTTVRGVQYRRREAICAGPLAELRAAIPVQTSGTQTKWSPSALTRPSPGNGKCTA